ncbi:MAG: alpha/beta hydrolase family protein [Candidatus Hydrogenedentota bacterium]
MLITTLTFALAALGAPDTLFFYAHEVAADEAVVLPEPGRYHVHAWCAPAMDTSVTLGRETLSAKSPASEAGAEAVWVHAGELTLDAGEVAALLGDGVYALALSTDARWRGEKALGNMRVFPDAPKAVHDARADSTRHTDTRFTMPRFDSLADWEPFEARLRRRILIASGLLPLPGKTPLNAKVFGRFTGNGFTVEKVYFEARPGFLVTGNLYRPAAGDGPFPAVVSPHGHWGDGRLANDTRGSVPGRCITLARMGCVVFNYDMIGYVDSLQFTHKWGGDREALYGLHPFAMQLWSSIRAVDFVQELDDVDPARIACTGASGGGTQTFALTAVDRRVKVAAPVNMISANMQGGCLCENAPIIRLDNSNMAIGACAAPRPLLLVSATGDWTWETPRVEYPSIRGVYALHDAAEKVKNVHIDAGHNYNQASREAMYRFFGRWLLNEPETYEDYTEPPFEAPPAEALRVFPDDAAPEGLPTQAEIIAQVIASTKAKWDAVLPERAEDVAGFKARYQTVLSDITGAETPEPNAIEAARVDYQRTRNYVREAWVLGRHGAGDAVPALFYRGTGSGPQDAVAVVHGEGKAALADVAKGAPGALVSGLIAQGKAVLLIDAFLIGEHHAPAERTVRHSPGKYLHTFQPSNTAHRIQDVLTGIGWLRARRDMTGTVDSIGLADGGVWVLFASAIDRNVRTTVVDFNGFDPANDEAWEQKFFIPCVRAVGDVRTAAVLVHPRELVVANAGGDVSLLGAEMMEVLPDAADLAAMLPHAL